MEDETGDVENQYYKAKCMSKIILISYLSCDLLYIINREEELIHSSY